MATKATTLFSLSKVKAYMPTTDASKDAILETIADGVSARVELLTSRKFVTRSVTEKGDAKGRQYVRLRDYPITAVASVKRRTDFNESWETLLASEYEADLRTGTVYLKNLCFYSGPLTYEVAYTAGFDAQDGALLPSDLVGAALEYVKFVFTRDFNGMLNATSFSGGGHWVAPVVGVPKDIIDAIMAHRKVRV